MMDNFFKEHLTVSNDILKSQIANLQSFVTDEQWREILAFDMALNPRLALKITEYINHINSISISSVSIEEIILKLRRTTLELIEEANAIDDTVLKWLKYREVYAHYGFLETIIEGSIITDYILDKIKEKYDTNYLTVLKVIDNVNPSKLTNLQKNEDNLIDFDDIVKLYLLMKKWQDDQHVFHDEVIFSGYKISKDNLNEKVKTECPHLKHIDNIYLVALYLLDKCSIIPIKLISRFVNSAAKDYLANVVGGKGLGLAILDFNNFKIPETYIISVGSLLNEVYHENLSNLKMKRFAIRSSATVEDNINNSFAGMFVSKLDVPFIKLQAAIKTVQASVSNTRVKEYISYFKTDTPLMAVVLQEYKEPTLSGVWIGKEQGSGYLEWIYGCGENLVSGKVTPNLENWTSNYNKNNFKKIGNQFIGESCLGIQQQLNLIADIEWCVINDEIIWLQLRPVTKTIIYDKNNINNNNNIYGVPASSGTAIGKPVFLKDINEKQKFRKGNILLTDYTDPDWLPIMVKSSGIVTAEGGVLSHSAIISRELGIPCIVGIGYDQIDYLKTTKQIEINGATGSIKIYKR